MARLKLNVISPCERTKLKKFFNEIFSGPINNKWQLEDKKRIKQENNLKCKPNYLSDMGNRVYPIVMRNKGKNRCYNGGIPP